MIASLLRFLAFSLPAASETNGPTLEAAAGAAVLCAVSWLYAELAACSLWNSLSTTVSFTGGTTAPAPAPPQQPLALLELSTSPAGLRAWPSRLRAHSPLLAQ